MEIYIPDYSRKGEYGSTEVNYSGMNLLTILVPDPVDPNVSFGPPLINYVTITHNGINIAVFLH
jgi:hypothetical protein